VTSLHDAEIAMTGERDGWVIARYSNRDQGFWADHGETVVVGSVFRRSPDGEPGEWRAYLWPLAGGAMRMGQSVDVIDAGDVKTLGKRLRARAGREPWWSVPDGRCPVVLEHAGRKSRCETTSAVAHDVHRHYADGVEWMSEEDFMKPIGGEGVESAV
jgi:hypothetical protein